MFYIFDISENHPSHAVRKEAWAKVVKAHLDEADAETENLTETLRNFFANSEEVIVFDTNNFCTYKMELKKGKLKRARKDGE
jgi:hypothetical protein